LGAIEAVIADMIAAVAAQVTTTCPFRKFRPAWIRIAGQNHRIIESDVCDPARAGKVRHRPIQVAVPA
jgi:hypothetical protein